MAKAKRTPTYANNHDPADGFLHETPSFEIYEPLQCAFNQFNYELFNDKLPDCVIAVHKKDKRSHGYYVNKNWRDARKRTDFQSSVIALNPLYFAKEHGGTFHVLDVLLHEMCHHWQFSFGKPSRRGYHNREWADKMVKVGLQPSNTGKPGGKIVGQKMADYPIAGGPFEQIAKDLIESGLEIPWAEIPFEAERKAATRVTYLCPQCHLRILGKRGIATLGCDCSGQWSRMDEVTEATGAPSKPAPTLI